MKKNVPIIEELLKYKKEENLILSMPGNKSGIGFLRDNIGKEFINNMGFLDITEVDPLDNLHNPEGIIKESQELLAKTYGVKKAYFLVNGSTSGNMASIFAAFKEGDEVLVERNCHKSIYNALILRKLKPIYIEANIDYKNEVLLPCSEENIMEALKKANNPKGIILTSPNYYGISLNLDNVLNDLKEKDLKIVIDGAHGAHYGASEKLPKGIFNIAHYVVVSAHKTLPALTQGAYLLVNEEHSNVKFYMSAFNTTSPSYLIMASLEYGRYYLDKYAREDYDNLIDRAEDYKVKINALNKVKIISDIDLQRSSDRKYILDKSRYIMTVSNGYSGGKLLDYLREKKIQSEMSFSKGVVLLLSPFNTISDFEKILKAIEELDIETLKENRIELKQEYNEVLSNKKYEIIKRLEPYEVYDMNYDEVKLEEAIGKISKDFIIPYPPGIPILLPGEEITSDIIEVIKEYEKNVMSIVGVSEGMIKVIKSFS